MRLSHYQSGARKDGFIMRIRVAGSNGIADIIWDGAVPTISVRSSAGAPFGDTSHN
jgi:hypothetical protein